ncbi:cytochrome P450 [bacterium]|nr:cytochrome P450 [bacterium]
MSNAPITHIDPTAFNADPYPTLARMRAQTPITYVPELGATLITRRDDIHREEKRTHVFSSDQPGGLMTVLMGQNMMRKDGAAHMAERKALFPTVSPRTVNSHWKPLFQAKALDIIRALKPKGACDLVTDYAMPVSAEALKLMTGLTEMTATEMDGVSQGMIDGCANYSGIPEVEARCNAATALIDAHINRMKDRAAPFSALKVQSDAGLSDDSTRANIKLVISGGQNEPRDAIAGTIWALLAHPNQLKKIQKGDLGWDSAFAEYARWQSPIGMSPRRVAQADDIHGVRFEQEDRVFLMFGSANRDEAHFADPDSFDVSRDTSAAIAFGAGPHFCAGAAASRCLITEIALPLAFEHLPGLRLAGDVALSGWAFRGPLSVPVEWDT